MAKKKSISENDIIAFYIDYVLEHNAPPKSVHAFAKAHGFEEATFYTFFGSFDAMEKQTFKVFFKNTIQVLEKSEDYRSFDARNKLLSWYFTFFENLTANRSYVVYALQKHKNSLKNLKVLGELRRSFMHYIGDLEFKTFEFKEEKLDKLQDRALQESAWLQFVVTLKFWLEDTSKAFEKTEIFIEKSVNTSFDFLNIAPFKSLIDLGKFILKEKTQMN